VGGAYFPTSIFPKILQNLSFILPQTQILKGARLIFSETNFPKESYLVLAFWLLALTAMVMFLNTYLTNHLKRIARFF
jgi:ABC-type polysaccharide/polyol phosphate export permease